MKPNEVLDKTESLLAHLICADATGEDNLDYGGRRYGRDGVAMEETDVTAFLKFNPEFPKSSFTTQLAGNDRVYSVTADFLMNTVQDIIGDRSEFSLICDHMVKWTCFKKISKAPRGVWVSSPGATLYECHFREIFPNGISTYFNRIVGITKKGRPVACLVQGSSGSGALHESSLLVLGASVIEDALRPNTMLATVSEGAAIKFPVPVGDHKEVFALRDAPLTSAGRRKALLHWVAGHTRRRAGGSTSVVSAHTRGVREFSVDGFTVRLEPND